MAVIDSPVDICNFALDKLGEENITSLTQTGSVEARYCNRFYDQMRREVLSEFEWSFATTRAEIAELTLDSDPYEYEYQYAYQLPPLCLTVQKIQPEETEYEVEGGRKLYINSTFVYLQYTYDEVDVTKYTDFFIGALASRLAAELAMPLQGRESRMQAMLGMYVAMLDRAKQHDSRQKRQPPSRVNDWVTP